MIKKTLLASVAALTVVITSGFLVAAQATQFSSGNASISGLGDEIDSGYDTFSITGLNGNWDTGNWQTLAGLTFTAAYNCNACALTPTGLLGFSLQVGSITETANVAWGWSSIGWADILDVTAPSDLTFIQATGEVDVVAFQATPSLVSTGDPVSENLMASVEVPEPASMALLGAGFAGLGMIRRRKAV
jgi:PEP-CTERM motif-containing protein